MTSRTIRIALVLVSATLPLSSMGCGSSSETSPNTYISIPNLPVVPDPVASPSAPPAMVDPSAQNPKDDAGNDLTWTTAPSMDGVTVDVNRDSALVYAPIVEGAKDYRVILLPAGTTVSTDKTSGGETVAGTTIFCGGYRQHAAPIAPRELLRRIEVTGLTGPTRMVIEAIDTACPFPGIRGQTHHDFPPPGQDVSQQDRVPFAVYTDQEIISKYGSLIINGQGHGATLASQADPITPKVLARTAIVVTPLGTATPPSGDFTFFDDFAGEDQPAYVKDVSDGNGRAQFPMLYQNSKWNFYTYDAANSQMYFDRGLMRFVLGDWSQDVMSSNFGVAKRAAAQLSTTNYLHVTFEVQNYATPRRYWWLFLCGADTPGQTLDASGNFLGNVIQTPFFMDDDGSNPSLEGWNCFQAFTRDGWPFGLPPDGTHPETELRLMLNKAGDVGRDNVVNTDPVFYPNVIGPPSWYRQIDATGAPVAPILDDQQFVAPRTHFDFYIRRDRVIVLVNGQQRACNDFTSTPLTMSEAAVGFGQVFYHSTGERVELPTSWDRTDERYIVEDSPYLDVRTYDNVGFAENVAAPAGFDDSVCYKYTP